MSKHTPGPWGKGYQPEEHQWKIHDGYNVVSSAHKRENATLIAAAPEMLEALEQIKGYLPDCEGDALQTIENIIDYAIAKAEGRDE